ncbi:MAG: hypothetical protein KGM60_06420 [Comamonadaceae bacterium]|nr:hypothetical protein [Pseudomonadota bacterium]MDE2414378.1 hypothetical protein [Comamonadaceae bacterium]
MNCFITIAALGLAVSLGAHAQQPLLDDEGRPLSSVPWAVPGNPHHSTRAGLYATEAQAGAHENALPGRTISVRAGCCGEQGLRDAMLSAWEQYVRLDAPSDTPVLVRGSDPQQAAHLVDRLTGAGFAPVFLVRPEDVRPLLDSRGELEPPEPAAMPVHPDHRTRAGLYATDAQAHALEDALGQRLIAVHVGCCGVLGIADAVRRVSDTRAAHGFPDTLPVLVYGDDPWHAARVVDELTDQGFGRVFLVRVR